ncbi:hypothetical protein NL676_024444 [Syzygium grande]|nr:hypothetical protein NL676_024444 [Syzygium grande]
MMTKLKTKIHFGQASPSGQASSSSEAAIAVASFKLTAAMVGSYDEAPEGVAVGRDRRASEELWLSDRKVEDDE